MMHLLAIIYLAAFALQLLPGSAFISKPKFDFGSPHVYFGIAQTFAGLSLSIYVLVAT